jgi:Bacterial Ig domain
MKTLLKALLACAVLPGVATGCGEESDGTGAAARVDVGVPANGAPASMHGDMVTPADNGVTTVQGALGGGGGGREPKVFYLRYADGTEQHTQNYDACTGTVPKFECSFAPTLVECQRQIQAYLDDWYKDFNIVFTLTRPTSGSYYTEVVSSGGGAWCKVSDKVAGVAPFLCKDLGGGVAYTFRGGGSARETAVIVAQEQAHLLGLEHTSNPHDLMYPTICTDCAGFVDDDSGVSADTCDRDTQNSYKMMKKALGDWPGGPKPSPFGCMDDTQDPSVQFLSPADGASMGHDFAVSVDVRDDCGVKKVEIQVMPQGLSAVAMAPPYEWDLTGINGAQTITVTATDGSGRSGHASLQVTAPESRTDLGPGLAGEGAGCTVASGAFGGLAPSLAMLLLFSRPNRRSRMRKVDGELSR